MISATPGRNLLRVCSFYFLKRAILPTGDSVLIPEKTVQEFVKIPPVVVRPRWHIFAITAFSKC